MKFYRLDDTALAYVVTKGSQSSRPRASRRSTRKTGTRTCWLRKSEIKKFFYTFIDEFVSAKYNKVMDRAKSYITARK